MDVVAVFVAVLALTFSCALCGMYLRSRGTDWHSAVETKEVLKAVMGLTATLAALVLGLLIASSKGSYDVQRSEVQGLSANIAGLDRLFQRVGPSAGGARYVLEGCARTTITFLWNDNQARATLHLRDMTTTTDQLFDRIQDFAADTSQQKLMQARALAITAEIARAQLLLALQKRGSLQPSVLILVIGTLGLLFFGYALLAPANRAVSATLFTGSFVVASAVALLVELDQPFQGLMQIPRMTMGL